MSILRTHIPEARCGAYGWHPVNELMLLELCRLKLYIAAHFSCVFIADKENWQQHPCIAPALGAITGRIRSLCRSTQDLYR